MGVGVLKMLLPLLGQLNMNPLKQKDKINDKIYIYSVCMDFTYNRIKKFNVLVKKML